MKNQNSNEPGLDPSMQLDMGFSPGPGREVVARTREETVLDEPSPLMTDEIRRRLPRLNATEKDTDPIVHVKYRARNVCDWNAVEFDGNDILFGLIWQRFPLWGYSKISELETANIWSGAAAIETKPRSEARSVSRAMMDYAYDI